MVFLHDVHIYLSCDLLLELVDLVGHYLQLAFHLCDLIPGLNQVLAAQVAITAHCLVECLCVQANMT